MNDVRNLPGPWSLTTLQPFVAFVTFCKKSPSFRSPLFLLDARPFLDRGDDGVGGFAREQMARFGDQLAFVVAREPIFLAGRALRRMNAVPFPM
jgi:hypothetical protein